MIRFAFESGSRCRAVWGRVGKLARGAVAPLALAGMAMMAGPITAQAQTVEVSGVIADTAGTALRNAMVVILTKPDSVLASFTLSNNDGDFTIDDVDPGEYILQVTMVGHQTLRTDISVTGTNFDAGTINLEVLAIAMEPLVISVDHVPFASRADTLDFNMNAFETRPNATVEELLDQLPGIDVAGDGSITAQGREVENVLVDGREFFDGDPTVATRNLPADAVERVQVYDRQSDMAEFTGIQDGDEEVTINLELREEARTGYFGNVATGLGGIVEGDTPVGPDYDGVRYDERFNISRFSPTVQLAVLGRLNNNNQTGFSWEETRQFSIDRRGGGSNSGITDSGSLGVNLSRDWDRNNYIRSSYFLSSIDNLQDRESTQQLLLGQAVSSIQDEDTNARNETMTHRFSLNAQKEFGEGHDLRLRSSFNARSSDRTNLSNQETRDAVGTLLNQATTSTTTSDDNLSGNARLTWRKRISDDGRTIVAEGRANLSRPEQSSLLTSEGMFGRGQTLEERILNQLETQDNQTLGMFQRLSLTEPLGGGFSLELFGERQTSDEDRNRTVLDQTVNPAQILPDLSSEFERTYTYLRGGTRISRRVDNWWTTLGLRVQNSDLQGEIIGRDASINNSYTHLLANLEFEYDFTDSKGLELQYETSTNEPSVTQLQPFVDNTNPLRLYEGNPDLIPEYSHELSGHFRMFDQFSFTNLFARGWVRYTKDPIVMSRDINDQAVQTLRPFNADQQWNVGTMIFYGRPIRKLGITTNMNYMFNRTTNTELVNGQENLTRILTNSVTMGIENRDQDVFRIDASATLGFNNVTYTLNPDLNQNYLNPSFRANGLLRFGTGWTAETNLTAQLYDKEVFGEDRNVTILNASLSRLVMGDRTEIRLSAMDLLNQNRGVRIQNTVSAITEERTQTLGRHLMLNVSYRLGPDGMGTSGGGMRGRGPRH